MENCNEKIKYVHLFNYISFGFTAGAIGILSSDDYAFDISEHLFVVRSESLLSQLQANFPSANVICDSDKKSLINKYAQKYQWIFVHGFMSLNEILFVQKKYLHKIIWRTWGSDAEYTLKKNQPFRNTIKHMLNYFRAVRIKKIAIVGIGSKLEYSYIEKTFGKVVAMLIPYSADKYEALTQIQENLQDETFNIMIGHSGFDNDFHKDMIQLFSKYADENVRFYFPVSYGNPEYIRDIEVFANSVLGEKALFIHENMEYSSYALLLSKMDIAVFYGLKSYALGNISILSFFKKWLLLNDGGVLQKAFNELGIASLHYHDIEKLSFTELKKKVRTANEKAQCLSPCDQNTAKQRWLEVLNFLDCKTDN